MNSQQMQQQMQQVRSLLQQTYMQIANQHSDILPTPDASVHSAGQLIQKEQYDVVVCGEVKKGKSSFINALMGDQVLPVATKEATCQVFRIINSDNEEFSLVFTDGARQRISRSELSRYGSQVDADLYGDPIMRGHQLDYIEVKHPIKNLPKSVALVDTPGIGAVYAAHEQITRNYLSKASAVIYVMSPENPLVASERAFIESILAQTNQILFVMTKMDDYDENVVDRMISRNKEILAPLASKTATGKILIQPVSSTLLFDATQEKDEILMDMSCFEDIKESLVKLVYNTVGFGISAEVYNAFNKHNTRVMQALTELKTAAANDQGAAKELAEKKRQKQAEFVQEWGSSGAKVREINDAIRSQVRTLETEANALFSANNSIYRNMQREIDDLSNSEQAERLSKNISSRLVDAYGKSWKDLLDRCEDSVENILIEYNARIDAVDTGNTSVYVDSFQRRERSLADRLSSGRNSYFTGAFVASVFAIPMAIVAAPLTLGIAALGALFGIGAGVATKRDAELKNWKQELTKYLHDCYSQIRDEFVVRPTNGKTKLHMAEDDIMSSSMKAVQKIYEQHKSNLDRQMAQLEEQSNADATARQRKLAEVEGVMQGWKPIYDNLQQAKNILTQMEQNRKLL